MNPEHGENSPTTNFKSISDVEVHKLFELHDRLSQANGVVRDLIFSFTNGQIGDIVEVFWSEGEAARVSASPSPEFRFLEAASESENNSRLFSSITTNPSPTSFDRDRSILFISPLMTPDDITRFIAQISDHNRGLVKRLAINHRKFETLDKTLLAKFDALKELILVSEISTENSPPPLGPIGPYPQRIVFEFAPSAELRSSVSWDPNDLRLQTQNELGKNRSLTNAWSDGFIKADVACIKRDGTLMETEFKWDRYKDLPTRMKEKEKAATRRVVEAEERNADSEYIEQPFGDADGGDDIENLNLEGLNVRTPDMFASRVSTNEERDAEQVWLDTINESIQREEERKRREEFRRQGEEIEDEIADYEEEVEDSDERIEDEDEAEDEDNRFDGVHDADVVEE